MNRDLLPIGTVVILNGTEKALMVCGYCPTSPARPGYVYDYSGFPYPEGCLDPLKVYQFDGEDIAAVLALGYQDRETHFYMRAVQENIESVKAEVAAAFANAKKEEEE